MVDGVTSSVHAAAQPNSRGRAVSSGDSRSEKKTADPTDALELSDAAQEQIECSGSPPVRAELVERIRAALTAGTYTIDDKLDELVERLHQELFGRA